MNMLNKLVALLDSRRVIDFVAGWFGTFDRNELEAVSHEDDPIKFRGAVNEDVAQTNLAAFSWNTRRITPPDGGGQHRHDEWGYFMGRRTADHKQGACYIALRTEDGRTPEHFYLDPGALIVRVPIYAPAEPDGTPVLISGGGSSQPPSPNELTSPAGLRKASLQDEGQFVIYKMGPDGRGTMEFDVLGRIRALEAEVAWLRGRR